MKSRLLVLFLIALLSTPLHAKAIHLLCLVDDEDPGVGHSVTVDLRNMKKSFEFLAHSCGIPVLMKTIRSPELKKSFIDYWLQTVSISKDDVVFLYYSGHGGRLKKSPTIWPFGIFRDKYTFEFTSLIEKILSKKAALNIVLLDCCNNFTAKAKQLLITRAFELKLDKLDPKLVQESCKKLFFETNGLILCSGAVPGKASECIVPGKGGYLTSYFLERFFKESQKPNPQWSRIFGKTKTKVLLETGRCPFASKQKIQYKMLLPTETKNPSTYKKFLYNDCKYKKSKDLDLDEEEINCFCGALKSLKADPDVSEVLAPVEEIISTGG